MLGFRVGRACSWTMRIQLLQRVLTRVSSASVVTFFMSSCASCECLWRLCVHIT